MCVYTRSVCPFVTQPIPSTHTKHSAPNAVGLAVVLCGGRPRLRPTRMLFRAPQAYLAAMALNFVLRYVYVCVSVWGRGGCI